MREYLETFDKEARRRRTDQLTGAEPLFSSEATRVAHGEWKID